MKKKEIRNILSLIVILLIIYLIFQEFYNYKVNTSGQLNETNYWPTDDWRKSTPEEQGMDSSELAAIIKDLGKYGVRSIVVIRNGYLVLEGYSYPYTKDTAFNVKSVNKSILSALTGIAIREKIIESVDQNVADILPEYFENADSLKRQITIKDLLTMETGLPTVEEGQYETAWHRSEDWVKYVIELPISSRPGATFNYSSWNTHIMSTIITEKSGYNTLEFAQKYLFNPMGITIPRWIKDPKGTYIGGFEMDMTTRDMAKFGYLYLNNGVWNNQQLVPKEWVETSTKNYVNGTRFGDAVSQYGYWWWLGRDYYMAAGWGGQYIIVNPKLNLVVALNSVSFLGSHNLYKSRICKAIESGQAIEPNPSAFNELQSNLAKIGRENNNYVTPDDELLKRINGKTITFKDNPTGIKSISLSFEDSVGTLTSIQVDINGKTYTSQYPFGLNGNYELSTDKHPVYYGYDRPFYPINTPDGTDEYTVALTGHWMDKNHFQIKHMGPQGDPLTFIAIYEFEDDKVNVNLTVIPTNVYFHIEGEI
jgi:CubicO group peptidase (beta-lactamase class C family)